MFQYLFKRLSGLIALCFLLSFAIYGLLGFMPGDPLDIAIASDPNMTSADAQRLKELQGLDRPLTNRYWSWLSAALTGEFGYSRLYNKPVAEILWERLLNTFWLMGVSFTLSVLIALILGVIAADRKGSLFDQFINLFAFAGFSIPSFWLGLLLILLFAVQLSWLPAGGTSSIGVDTLADRLRYLALPVLTLTILGTGSILRFVRSAMIEALSEDYIRTARSKGCSRTRILWSHAFPNALLPVMTIIMLQFGTLFSGALVIETIFSYLGMGKLIYDSIIGSDYNLALAGLMLSTIVILLANLMADCAYFLLDPRISLES